MRKLIAGAAFAGTVIVGFGVGDAAAGKPTEPGCVGESVSANAHARVPYGGFIRELTPRNALGTLADAVHALQSGEIDDSVYVNTCN